MGGFGAIGPREETSGGARSGSDALRQRKDLLWTPQL